jgi:CHASE2 domain-containing sensor protein
MNRIKELLRKFRHYRRYRAAFAIILCAGFFGLLSMTKFGRESELLTLKHRYLIRGEKRLAEEIVLVLNDENSQRAFGRAPHSKKMHAEIIDRLFRLGARVIGIDFRFETPESPYADSLMRRAINRAGNVVIGCSFQKIKEIHDDGEDRNTKSAWSVVEYPYFVFSPASAHLSPELLESKVRIGNIDVFIDTLNNHGQSLPLFVDEHSHQQPLPLYIRKDSVCAAFALEVVKAYLGISNREIKIAEGKLVLMPAGREPIRIPMSRNGEYFINHLGYRKTPENYYSWSEILSKAARDTSSSMLASNFKDKIVLVGSLVEEDDKLANPYSVELPGVLVHTMVIDNILREQFLMQFPHEFQFLVLGLLGVVLWWLFIRFKHFWQIVGGLLLWAVYAGMAFVLFNEYHVVLPLSAPSGFLLLCIGVRAHQGYLSAMQTNAWLLGRLNQVRENVELLSMSLGDRGSTTAYYRLIIFAIEESEQCMFPHWLDFSATSTQQVPTIVRKPVGLHPVRIEAHAVKKLNYSIKNLWQIYYDYVRTGKINDTKPADRLREIGSRIAKEFGLNATLQDLLRSEDKTIPLNLIVTKLNLPWPWAYAAESKQFLCEAYAIGTSFAIGKNAAFQQGRIETDQGEGKSSKKMAILFYGDWNGHPGKHLQHVRDQIVSLQSLIIRQDCSTMVIQESCTDFLARLAQASANRENLRFIHYTGHAEGNHLDVGKENFLRPGMISEVMGVSFPSRPLIFLNACSSGLAQEEWDSFDNISTEFLACGAGACIVTSHDVYEKTAGRFALIFYDYFVNQKLAAGEALRLTINDLSQPDPKNNYDPDYDITRYFYQLYGDPMVKF